MASAAEEKLRSRMAELQVEAAQWKLDEATAKQKKRLQLQGRLQKVLNDFRGDKEKELEKQQEESGIPLEPIPTPFNLQNTGRGNVEAVPAPVDMPKEGGGGLGQAIREAMAGVPESLTQRQTTTEWAPHRWGTGYIGMPTTRTTTTQVPTGMTQYQAGSLALAQRRSQMEQQRAEARMRLLNRQTQNDMQRARRADLATYAKMFGSIDDAINFMSQDPEEMSPELKQKITKVFRDEKGRQIRMENFDMALRALQLERDWLQVGRPSVSRKAEAGAYTSLSQVGLDELMGLAPLETLAQKQKAEGQMIGGMKALNAADWDKGVKPGMIYSTVAMPASHLGKAVVYDKNFEGKNKPGIRLINMFELFTALDTATMRPATADELRAKEVAKQQLRDWEIVEEFDTATGDPRPMTGGYFMGVSAAYLKAYEHLNQVANENPDLTEIGAFRFTNPERDIVARRRREIAERTPPEAEMAVRRRTLEGVREIFNQVMGEAR